MAAQPPSSANSLHGSAGQDLVPASTGRILSAPEFQQLADVPPETQWFANIDNPNTRRAYRDDLDGFIRFAGIQTPEEFRQVTRSHILAWRAELEKQSLAGSTVRRKLAALSSLFEYLCNQNAVTHNPVKGVKRAAGGKPSRGDAGADQSTGAQLIGCAAIRHAQGEKGSGDFERDAAPWVTAGGSDPIEGEGFCASGSGGTAHAGMGQRGQGALSAC